MPLPDPKRIILGLLLTAIAIGIAYHSTTTRIVSELPLQRETRPNDVNVSFGPEIEDRMVRVDLRIPAVFGLIGVGLIVSAFIHRRD